MTILNFTVAFIIDTRRPRADGTCNIYIRIIRNRVIAMLKIGEYIKPEHWDKAVGRVTPRAKDYVRMNHRIISIQKQVEDIRYSLETENKTCEAKDIIRMLKGEHIQRTRLMDFFDLYIEEMKARPKEFTHSVVNHYKQAQEKLRSFLALTREEKIFLSDFSGSHIDRWKHYLLSTNFENTGHPLNENTTNRYLTKLRAVFNKALVRELITRSPFANIRIKEVNGKREYLTMDELNRLASHNLGSNISLAAIRDSFIFSCYAPCRFQDLINLKLNNFYTDEDNITWVAYRVQKTDTLVEIPLFKEAEAIYRKYSGAGKRESNETLFRGISNQRYNTNLGIISQMVGLNKKITHHCSRATAASSVLLGRNIGLRETQQFMSHASISSTLVYTKVSKSIMSSVVKRIDRTA
jgi:site-specific recombinase XerD